MARSRKMVVAVIGNYMSNNLGDDLYLHQLGSKFPEHQFIAHSKLEKTKPDYILFGGGGVLRDEDPRVQLLMEWTRQFNVPYGVFSVGCADNTENYTNRNRFFGDADFVTVRDPISADAIPGSVLLPDLAWTYMPEATANVKSDTGIMLRHSLAFNSFDLVVRTRELMSTMQGDFRFFSTYGERIGDRTLAHATRAGFPSTFSLYTGNKLTEYLDHHYRRVSQILVMPLHGIILAAIYNVPWAGWAYSYKTRRIAEELSAHISTDLQGTLHFNITSRSCVSRLRELAEKHFTILARYLP